MNTKEHKPDERAELMAQLEEVNATITTMQSEIEQLKPLNAGVNSLRLGDLLRDVGDLQATAEVLKENIARVDKIEAYQAAVDRAIETAKETHQRLADLEHRITAIDTKAATVRQRINEMQNQAQKTEDETRAAEAEAARAYAVAVASGDSKAEKVSHGKVQETQAAVTAVQEQNAKNSIIIDALTAEASALEEQINELKIERDELRKQLFISIRVHLAGRWDAIVADLVEIGSSLMAADVLAGLSSSELIHANLPLFSKKASIYQDFYSMRKLARNISDAELLKSMEVTQ